MKNLKEHIFEKLKVAKHYVELPDIKDFGEALYKFNNAHKISFENIDPKYRDIKNCPQYENKGTIYYVVYLYESVCIDNNMYLCAFYSNSISKSIIGNFVVESMDQLVELLGEELVLQIWEYIK